MTFIFTKPMLAAAADLSQLSYPLLATPKLDGIRCLKIGDQALTRSLKPIPNRHIRALIEQRLPEGADGEIVCPGLDFSGIQSAVMREAGTPDFEFHWFDLAGAGTYLERVARIGRWPAWASFVCPLLPTLLRCQKDVLVYEQECLAKGYEGIILRHPHGPYKGGRSTVAEGYLLKYKRFADAEAVVSGLRQMTDKDGQSKDTLGALHVRDIATGREFDIGTGFSATERAEIFAHPADFLGRTVRYRFQKHGGKHLPRFPVFAGFRDAADVAA